MEKVEPKKHGTAAERAAFDLVWYFKVVLSEERPAYFSEENVQMIAGIVQNIVKAAVDEAEHKMLGTVRARVREAMQGDYDLGP